MLDKREPLITVVILIDRDDRNPMFMKAGHLVGNPVKYFGGWLLYYQSAQAKCGWISEVDVI